MTRVEALKALVALGPALPPPRVTQVADLSKLRLSK